MDTNDIQLVKSQINSIRRWFYLGARAELGVDIRGIALPHIDATISGTIPSMREAQYDYLEPTDYDRAQDEASEQAEQEEPQEDKPRIYIAMSRFLAEAMDYLEARQLAAAGEKVHGMDTRQKNVQKALAMVAKESVVPPFPEAKPFIDAVLQQAQVAMLLLDSERSISFEQAEMKLLQVLGGGSPIKRH